MSKKKKIKYKIYNPPKKKKITPFPPPTKPLLRLLYLNWKNIVISRRLKIFNKLISLVRRVHGVSPKESIQKYARFIYKNSLNQESKQLERLALTHE